MIAGVLFVLLLGLVCCESMCRHVFSDTAYVPGKEVLRAQSFLKLHPRLGYLWQENISSQKNIVLKWNDVINPPLSTDARGFWNPLQAIQDYQKGKHINVIGLGDSFVHNAAPVLYSRFKSKGIFYYNMAMCRYSPPQYNIILEEYALAEKPDYIIYGLHASDFYEVADFEAWQDSTLDWFTFHSGTFCGPPQPLDPFKRYFFNHLKGTYALYRLAASQWEHFFRVKQASGTDQYSGENICRNISACILKAKETTQRNDIKFILVIMPTKYTTFSEPPSYPHYYDKVVSLLKDTDVSILDLRKFFARAEDPRSFFYERDGHWNDKGMALAADILIDFIMRTDQVSRRIGHVVHN